jgi:hypothetical protein
MSTYRHSLVFAAVLAAVSAAGTSAFASQTFDELASGAYAFSMSSGGDRPSESDRPFDSDPFDIGLRAVAPPDSPVQLAFTAVDF